MENLAKNATMIGLVLLAACSPGKKAENEKEQDSTEVTKTPPVPRESKAMAKLTQANSSGVTGTVTFTAVDDKTVKLAVNVQHIVPGEHALHLHEKGDCSAPDATSAGGHWNPDGMPHGKRGEGQYHKGDVGNVTAAGDSSVVWSAAIKGWTIGGPDSTNILNKAVIIHDGADDFVSQPSGDAGSRIACGVIMED